MDYIKLKELLDQPEYVGLSDKDAALALNTPSEPGPAQVYDVVKLLVRQGAYAKIALGARGTDDTARLCINSLRMLDSPDQFGALDMNDSDLQAVVAGLVTAGVITQAQADACTALSDNVLMPAQIAGIDSPSVADVQKARAM